MKIISFLFLNFVILSLCFSIQAQKSTTQLIGRIFDLHGAVIPNIRVMAISQPNKKYEALTNENGVYTLDLPEGIYTVAINPQEIKYNAFESIKFENYRIVPAYDGRINLDVPLSVFGDGIICRLDISDSSEQSKSDKIKKKNKNKSIKRKNNKQ